MQRYKISGYPTCWRHDILITERMNTFVETRNFLSLHRAGYAMCGIWLRVENTLLLLFLEYTLPEGIKLLFHGNGDNQFFDGSDEIDDPIDSDKAHVYVILKPILE